MNRSDLASVRLVAAIAHALHDRVALLTSSCGRSVQVSFRVADEVSMTPCALRKAIAMVWPGDEDGTRLAPILGLPAGPLRAWIMGGRQAGDDLGLGIHLFRCQDEWGYAFGSLLDVRAIEATVREAVCELRSEGGECPWILEHGAVKIAHDPELETSVLFVAYGPDVPRTEAAADVATAIAAACGAAELAGAVFSG